eukprot:403370568
MLSKDQTPQYYSPQKRKEFKEHLASSSIKFNQQEMPHEIMKRQPIKQSSSHVDVFYFVGGNMSQPKQQVSSNKNLNQMKFVVNRDSLVLYNLTPSQDSFIYRVQNRHAQVLSSTCFQQALVAVTENSCKYLHELECKSLSSIDSFKQRTIKHIEISSRIQTPSQSLIKSTKVHQFQNELLQQLKQQLKYGQKFIVKLAIYFDEETYS